MKKEQLAKEYADKVWGDDWKWDVDKETTIKDFTAGYNTAINLIIDHLQGNFTFRDPRFNEIKEELKSLKL